MPSNNKFMDRHTPFFQAGFSLIEIMVGLVIGLLATLVITQVFSIFEGQKRSTMGTADAQTNGSIALFNVQREVQMAGFGLPVFDTVNPPLNCNPSPTIGGVDMFPISITDGGAAAGASDSVTVRFGPTATGGIPANIIGLTANVAGVNNNLGCQVGDIALISQGTACVMTTVTGPTDIAVPAVATSPPDTTSVALASAVGVSVGASLACIGGWNQIVYAVNNGQLEKSAVPIVADVINIQAQYGISDPIVPGVAASNVVTSWVDATAASGFATPTIADRNRIKAIRVAVVARNGLLEKPPAVTTACSSITAATPTGLCAWEGTAASPAPAINLLDDDADHPWNQYRYRVFETIIPLRNMIWSWNTL